MPRRPRQGCGQLIFHVMNRAVQNLVLFECQSDYGGFIQIFLDTMARIPMRVLAYALMPNHWHLVLWPLHDGDLPAFMKWLTATHAQALRRANGSSGRGAVYQGRYKAIAVQSDRHLVQLCRYVERNPLRGKLVAHAEDWQWTSAAPEASRQGHPELARWPIPRPDNWLDLLNTPEPVDTLKRIRTAIRYGRHFGTLEWRIHTAERLAWREGYRGRGRTWETRPAEAGAELDLTQLHTIL